MRILKARRRTRQANTRCRSRWWAPRRPIARLPRAARRQAAWRCVRKRAIAVHGARSATPRGGPRSRRCNARGKVLAVRQARRIAAARRQAATSTAGAGSAHEASARRRLALAGARRRWPAAGGRATITHERLEHRAGRLADLAYFYRRAVPHAPRFSLVGGGTGAGIADAARGVVDAGWPAASARRLRPGGARVHDVRAQRRVPRHQPRPTACPGFTRGADPGPRRREGDELDAGPRLDAHGRDRRRRARPGTGARSVFVVTVRRRRRPRSRTGRGRSPPPARSASSS